MLKKLIFVGILLIFIQSAISIEMSQVYDVVLKYNEGAVSIDSLFLSMGYVSDGKNPPDIGYKISLLDVNGKEIYHQKFIFDDEVSHSIFDSFNEKGE